MSYSFRRALIADRTISPVLVVLYQKAGKSIGGVNESTLLLTLTFLAGFVVLTTLLTLQSGEYGIDRGTFIALLILFGGALALVVPQMVSEWRMGQKFIRDCEALQEQFIPYLLPAYMSEKELRNGVELALRQEATIIMDRHSLSPGDPTIDRLRSEFGKMFDIGKKFGLTADNWEPYFEKAEASETVAEETVSPGAPTFTPATN